MSLIYCDDVFVVVYICSLIDCGGAVADRGAMARALDMRSTNHGFKSYLLGATLRNNVMPCVSCAIITCNYCRIGAGLSVAANQCV